VGSAVYCFTVIGLKYYCNVTVIFVNLAKKRKGF
jgi:hypothetical protein